jgi:hypothetical protein
LTLISPVQWRVKTSQLGFSSIVVGRVVVDVPFVIFVHQRRRANFLLVALQADDANEIGASQSQLLVLAKLVQLLEMIADHDVPPTRILRRQFSPVKTFIDNEKE